jgi:hypothetical protein
MSLGDTFTLVNETVTAAITAQQFTAITGLEGITALTLEAVFSGTGGSTAVATVRTRINSAGSWREIARFDFAAAGAKMATLTKAAAAVASFSSLSADSVLNGFLGAEYDLTLTTTGTWTNGLMTVRGHAS